MWTHTAFVLLCVSLVLLRINGEMDPIWGEYRRGIIQGLSLDQHRLAHQIPSSPLDESTIESLIQKHPSKFGSIYDPQSYTDFTTLYREMAKSVSSPDEYIRFSRAITSSSSLWERHSTQYKGSLKFRVFSGQLSTHSSVIDASRSFFSTLEKSSNDEDTMQWSHLQSLIIPELKAQEVRLEFAADSVKEIRIRPTSWFNVQFLKQNRDALKSFFGTKGKCPFLPASILVAEGVRVRGEVSLSIFEGLSSAWSQNKNVVLGGVKFTKVFRGFDDDDDDDAISVGTLWQINSFNTCFKHCHKGNKSPVEMLNYNACKCSCTKKFMNAKTECSSVQSSQMRYIDLYEPSSQILLISNVMLPDDNAIPDSSKGSVVTAETDVIKSQSELLALRSSNGQYNLYCQNDGNLVIYKTGDAIWSTNTHGNPNSKCVLQSDGNLVIYASSGRAIWSSRTANRGQGPFTLRMQDNSNLVLIDSVGKILWQTNPGAVLLNTGIVRRIREEHPQNAIFSSVNGGSVDRVLTSLNGRFRFVQQQDGNAVIYDGSKAIWSTRVQSANAKLYVQKDGNIVCYSTDGRAIWSSRTAERGIGPYTLVLMEDGDLLLVDSNDMILWGALGRHKGYLSDEMLGRIPSPPIDFDRVGEPPKNIVYSNVNGGIVTKLESSNGRFRFVMQTDNNAVVYDNQNRAVWSTRTHGRGGSNGRLVMQNDCNLVVYSQSGVPQWDSKTVNQHHPCSLYLANDGSLVVYNSEMLPLWWTK